MCVEHIGHAYMDVWFAWLWCEWVRRCDVESCAVFWCVLVCNGGESMWVRFGAKNEAKTVQSRQQSRMRLWGVRTTQAVEILTVDEAARELKKDWTVMTE